MWVLCDDSGWARVEEVDHSDEWEVVYNMRVADAHTYFVGQEWRGYAVWVHNAYNIALGLKAAGLYDFAKKYDAKTFRKWKAENFGAHDDGWNPDDTTGGAHSPFAKAFRAAVQHSDMIYFLMKGLDPTTIHKGYDNGIAQNTVTSWEFWTLLTSDEYKSRRESMSFSADGNSLMTYGDAWTAMLNVYKPIAKKYTENIPGWKSEKPLGEAIRAFLDLGEAKGEDYFKQLDPPK